MPRRGGDRCLAVRSSGAFPGPSSGSSSRLRLETRAARHVLEVPLGPAAGRAGDDLAADFLGGQVEETRDFRLLGWFIFHEWILVTRNRGCQRPRAGSDAS